MYCIIEENKQLRGEVMSKQKLINELHSGKCGKIKSMVRSESGQESRPGNE